MNIYEITAQFKKVGVCPDISFTTPNQVVDYMKGAFDDRRDQEQFWIICLDGANQPIGRRLLTLGLVNKTQIHAREAFRIAIAAGAVSVIFIHNHPSGSLTPSKEDISTTRKLVDVGELIDIPVLDHLIMNDNSAWTSIKAHNPGIFV